MKKKATGKKAFPIKKVSQTKAAAKSLNLPKGWYVMIQSEISVEELWSVMSQNLYETEIWKDAGVLEVILKEKCSLDLEACPLDLEDEYSNEFLEARNIHSLFYASFPEEAYEEARTALCHILAAYDGIVCGDTEDFYPRIEA